MSHFWSPQSPFRRRLLRWFLIFGITTHVYIVAFHVPWVPFRPTCGLGGGEYLEIQGTLSEVFAREITESLQSFDVIVVRLGREVWISLGDDWGGGGDILNSRIKTVIWYFEPRTADNPVWVAMPDDLKRRIESLEE